MSLISNFDERKDILVIPSKLNLDMLPIRVASIVKGWENRGLVIRIKNLDRPAIVRSRS
jgi:hypothetical protein